MRAFCIKCGTEQFDDAVFCHVCGAAVRRASEPVAQSVPQPVVVQPEPQTIPQPVHQDIPQPVHQEPVYQSIPQTAPPTEPQSAYHEVPQSVPQPIPQSAPQMDPWAAAGWTEAAPQVQPIVPPSPAPQPKPFTLPPVLKKLLTPKKRLSRPVTVLQRLTSCLLVFVMIAAVFVAISAIQYNGNSSEFQIRQSIEQALDQADLSELPADEFAPLADPSLTVDQWFAQELGGSFSPSVNIKSSRVEKFLDNANLADFIAENTSEMLENVADNRKHTGLHTDNVYEFLTANELALYNLVGTTSTSLSLPRLSEHLTANGLAGHLGASTMRQDNPTLYFFLQFLTLSETLTLAMSLILLVAILLLLNNRGNIFRAFFDVGVGLLIPGGLLLIVCFFYQSLSDSWSALFGYFAGHIVGDIIAEGQTMYLLLSLVGIAMLVIHGIWHDRQKKLKKLLSQPSEPETSEPTAVTL